MIYVKHGHGKWVAKDLDPLNPINQIREMTKWVFERYDPFVNQMQQKHA